MQYSSPQIVAAFLDANEVSGWSARSYTTEELDHVHFTCPSRLIRVIYDCKAEHFLIRFDKLIAAWGDYTKAICRSCHYIYKTLQAGGLDFTPPEDELGIPITVYPQSPQGYTIVKLGKHI